MLGQRDFDLFKLDKRKKPDIIPVWSRDVKSLWEQKYQGVYIVQQASVHSHTSFRQVAQNEVPLENSLVPDFNQPGAAYASDTIDMDASLLATAGNDLAPLQMQLSNPSAHTNPPIPSIQPNISGTPVTTSTEASIPSPGDFSLQMPPNISPTQTNPPLPSLQPNLSRNMIELSIVGRNLTECLNFGKNCKPQDVYASVSSRFAISDFLSPKNENREQVLPKRSNLSLAQWAIRSGTTYVIEEDVDGYLSLQQIQHEEPSADEDPDITIRRVMNQQEFHLRRIQAYTASTTTQQLLLRRDHIVDDAVQQYQDIAILHHKLSVKFDGEKGEDLDGLTREFFSLFSLNPTKMIDADELKAVGRILMHGYILCGYFHTS
eukprot:Seg3578.3 transcript_id=Seg3578.3/GoldUCD/mRNA.D3Y31 product="Ubiquitin-protein ligase E3A" protein_id=Seg3578.3/GoldUCD/D3Y31